MTWPPPDFAAGCPGCGRRARGEQQRQHDEERNGEALHRGSNVPRCVALHRVPLRCGAVGRTPGDGELGRFGWVVSCLSPLGGAGAADDQAGVRRTTRTVPPRGGPESAPRSARDCRPDLLSWLLHRRQRDTSIVGIGQVVEPDNSQVVGYLDARLRGRLQHLERHRVVDREHRVGTSGPGTGSVAGAAGCGRSPGCSWPATRTADPDRYRPGRAAGCPRCPSAHRWPA